MRARELMQHIVPQNRQEKQFVKKELEKAMDVLKNKSGQRVEVELDEFNQRGIFGEDMNKSRANARMAIQMETKAKFSLR